MNQEMRAEKTLLLFFVGHPPEKMHRCSEFQVLS